MAASLSLILLESILPSSSLSSHHRGREGGPLPSSSSAPVSPGSPSSAASPSISAGSESTSSSRSFSSNGAAKQKGSKEGRKGEQTGCIFMGVRGTVFLRAVPCRPQKGDAARPRGFSTRSTGAGGPRAPKHRRLAFLSARGQVGREERLKVGALFLLPKRCCRNLSWRRVEGKTLLLWAEAQQHLPKPRRVLTASHTRSHSALIMQAEHPESENPRPKILQNLTFSEC